MTALFHGLVSAVVALGSAGTVADTVAYEFQPPSAADWFVVNDGVMGGLSSSDFSDSGQGHAVFSGTVSLENNGGFASVRGLVPAGAMSGYRGVAMRVRGDGRTYQLRFRTDRRFDGVAYKAEFETRAGVWQTILLPFSEFEPTFRGRRPRGAAPLDPSAITQIGLLIADKVEGRFELSVEWIRAAS
jgi:monofunctional biosynthetic peptidoglycan transglycosylase